MAHESVLLLVIFGVCGLFLLNLLSYYSGKFELLPDVVWILLLGVCYSFLSTYFSDVFPEFSLQPEIVLQIFVPLLIFSSTQKMCLSHFQKVLTPASIIASLGILISMFVIGIPLYLFFNFSLLESLLFGVIVSATDPLAVGALLHKNKDIDESQKLLIEGESILNDGFVVTISGILVAIIFSGKSIDLSHAVLHLGQHLAGAILLGIIIGRLARWILFKWHEINFLLTVNMTVIVAYGSFFLAEYWGFSGILSVFSAALAYGYKPDKTYENKEKHDSIWDYFEYIANSILFFILGASLLSYFSWEQMSVLLAISIILLLIASRFSALLLLYPFIHLNNDTLSKKQLFLLNFAGARGAVSVALILLLPDTFILKSLFLSLTFIMIFTSLICYPLIIKNILKKP